MCFRHTHSFNVALSCQPEAPLPPRRRTKATTSIQNESDAYIAALSGKKVEINKNPYLENQSTSNFIEMDDEYLRSQILSDSRPRPTGPAMSYAERLKKAREEKAGQQAPATTPPAASAPQPPQPAAATPSAQTISPPGARSSLTYAERLQQAREAKAVTTGGVRGADSGGPVAPSREVPQQQPAVTIREVPQPRSADPSSGREGSKPESKVKLELFPRSRCKGGVAVGLESVIQGCSHVVLPEWACCSENVETWMAGINYDSCMRYYRNDRESAICR